MLITKYMKKLKFFLRSSKKYIYVEHGMEIKIDKEYWKENFLAKRAHGC